MDASKTAAYAKHEAIQAFKRSEAATWDGVNYANVVAPQLYDGSWTGLAKRLAFSLLFSLRTERFTPDDHDILLFYSCRAKRRSDYDFIAAELRRIIGEDGDYAEAAEHLDVFQWVATLSHLPSALKSVSAYRAKWPDRLGAAFLIAKYRSAKRRLAPLLAGKQRLVTFCDALATDNLLAQMARSDGLFTITAQHGQYRLLDSSNISPDAEAYANFVSDRMLCWGEATRAEFVRAGFHPDRFVVTGWIKAWKTLSQGLASEDRTKVFGVMLNGANGKESNLALISTAKVIARETGMSYLVRAHPHTPLDTVRPLLDERCKDVVHMDLDSYLRSVSLSVGHMSGAIVEVLHEFHPTYLIDDGCLADAFRLDGLSYSSAEEIVAAIMRDATSTELTRDRMSYLNNWYNDCSDQEIRIRQVICGSETNNA